MSLELSEEELKTAIVYSDMEVFTEVDGIAGFEFGKFVCCDPFTSDEEFDIWRKSKGDDSLPRWLKKCQTRDHFFKNVLHINSIFNTLKDRGKFDTFVKTCLELDAAKKR